MPAYCEDPFWQVKFAGVASKIGQNGRFLLDKTGHSLGRLKMFSIDENAVTMISLFADDESNDMSHADLPFDHYH